MLQSMWCIAWYCLKWGMQQYDHSPATNFRRFQAQGVCFHKGPGLPTYPLACWRWLRSLKLLRQLLVFPCRHHPTLPTTTIFSWRYVQRLFILEQRHMRYALITGCELPLDCIMKAGLKNGVHYKQNMCIEYGTSISWYVRILQTIH